ncbi:MAG: Tim44 domain-containing protein [Syntrophobacteraceae bacterium]
MIKRLQAVLVLSTLLFFGSAIVIESTAWARAGGGRSSGSRGSKSFSSPKMPSQSSPGIAAPGRNPAPGSPAQPSGGFFGRNPFMAGLAGGLAGGMLGGLLFGGTGHAASGTAAGGGIGLMDIAILGLLLYLAYRFFRKRRAQNALATGYYSEASSESANMPRSLGDTAYPYSSAPAHEPEGSGTELDRSIEQMKTYDPAFNEEKFKETAQDLFFRIQAGWANRSIDGIESIMTTEMADFFQQEFELMKQKGIINRLENIAIRKVELAEAWQEVGKDYITVLITANLLDYTVDANTREVMQGDKLNPVKFQEFWTFCRDVGSPRWQLAAINQPGEAPSSAN